MKLDKRLVALISSKAGSGGGVSEEAVTTMITAAINSLIDSAPEEYDTLGKIAAKLLLTDEQIQTIMTQVADRYTKEETNELVSKIPKFAIEVVTVLPTEDISTTTVYLKTGTKSDPDNIYDEYIYVKSKWELLGSQTIDLSGYVTTDAMNAALKNKLDTSGGTLTGALTTQDVNINGRVAQGTTYLRKILGALDIGTKYSDLDSKYKDGTYHRMWRLRFDSNVNFSGKIRVDLRASFYGFNAIGSMSKTINCGVANSNIYNNIGYYDSLGYLTEQDFRISELIWNNTANAWEILIWQKNLAGNNAPTVMLELFGGTFNATAQPVELTQMISYTAPKASPTGGNKVVNWEDTPVFETPYGKEIATTDLATTSVNGLMSKDDKKKLDGIAVDDSISTTSTNLVQNKAVGLKFQGVDSVLNSTADEIAAIVNVYGSKNLVDTSLIPNSTGGGVTRKNNGDGSITYSGTSTLTTTTYLPLMAKQSLGAGTYIFTSNPTTTASYTYQIYKNGSYWKGITVNQAIEITEAGKYSIGIALNSNATINNTFKPMLRYAAIKDDTYVPYAMTNRELTEKVADTGWVEVDFPENTNFDPASHLQYRRCGNIVSFWGEFKIMSNEDSSIYMSLIFKNLPKEDVVPEWLSSDRFTDSNPSTYVAEQRDPQMWKPNVWEQVRVYRNGWVQIDFRTFSEEPLTTGKVHTLNVTYML